MLPSRSMLIAALVSLALLSGCGSSSYGTMRGLSEGSGSGSSSGGTTSGDPIGGGSTATGTDNAVVATPSIQGTVSVVAGAQRNVAISFTSSDGRKITGFGISGSLGNLPPGWRGPQNFSCPSVSTGSGCVLNLTYAPTAVASGSFVISYVFVDNASMPDTGGTLTVNYEATPQNNVVATTAPTGQIDAVAGGTGVPVTVTFTTDDGTPATDLTLTTPLSSLPAGWHASAPSFGCASVSTGSGCELSLQYAPGTPGGGTLALTYGYLNNAGIAKTATVAIAYAATSHDNVIGNVSPGGEVTSIVGGQQGVTVTFDTDDGHSATDFSLTVDNSSLPAGWSSTVTTLACATVSTGTGCQLPLQFAPQAAGGGTLTLAYSYFDNSGSAQNGTVAIDYRGTVSDSVAGTASPAALSVATGSSNTVTVTFATNDGNPASALSVSTDLSSLPTGWSAGSGTFACPSVSNGAACAFTLTYAPSAAASGTLQLAYGYTDDAGTAKTGTVSIPYAAAVPVYLYLAEYDPSQTYGGVVSCRLLGDGTLDTCISTASAIGHSASGIAFQGAGHAYVTDGTQVYVCNVPGDGTLTGCLATGSDLHSPFELAVTGNILYATDSDTSYGVTTCTIASDYTLQGCSASAGSGDGGIGASSSTLFATIGNDVESCQIGSNGSLQGCASFSGFNGPLGITPSGGYAYVANAGDGTVSVCTLAFDGALQTPCASSSVGSNVSYVAFNGADAYVNDLNGTVYLCGSDPTTGVLQACSSANGGNSLLGVIQIAIH